MNIVRCILHRQIHVRQLAVSMSGSAQETINVLHNKEKNNFIVHLEKGDALLDYDMINGTTMDLYHTEVPTAYRGHGIAKHLVQNALKYALDNSLKVKPTCTYVLKYINENPDPSLDVVR